MAKATRAAEALSAIPTDEDRQYDLSLRPTHLTEYIGQTKAKENLRVYIRAAVKRREALDHVLLTGPPGLGKTTLAHIIANEMGAQLRSTSGPAIEKTGDIAALLTNLQEGDVLFIDEIHRLLPALEEKLYPAMEDFSLELLIGQGPRARDYAEVDYEGRITLEVAKDALNRMEVDTYGLDEMDRKLLSTIIEKFEGGPVGVGTLSAAIQEERDSIEEIIEPYLIQIGFLNRTPRGRMATQLAYQHFGIKTGERPPSLFDSAK